ncbi:MAG: DUF1737 domain-containing protein [Kiloniellales bacterium]
MAEERKAYRLLTGPDDAAFCLRVSDALKQGYVLWGSPAIAIGSQGPIVAQALVLPAFLPSKQEEQEQ